ncbi:MAG: type II secretion system F family protein [Gammaproteobacteria bacterium]|nr:type II secretion system F family protein [Gammaproteobacteria bacterium]
MTETNFYWEGANADGNIISGTIAATSFKHCKQQLREHHLFPIKIKRQTRQTPRRFFTKNKISPLQIADFCEQLAVLFNANIPLVTALEIIANDMKVENVRHLILKIKSEVESGHALHTALKKYPQHFNQLFCGLVYAGEQSGTLDIMLHEITNYLQKTSALKQKIIRGLIYPAMVFIATLIVSTILLVFVVPQFQSMFKSFNATLPFYTRCIIHVASLLKKYLWEGCIGFSALVFYVNFKLRRSRKFKLQYEALLLKLPLIGSILTKISIYRFAKTLAITYKAGLPLLTALALTGNILTIEKFSIGISLAQKHIADGKALHAALSSLHFFPAKVIKLIAVGEESGSLDLMLEKISDYYETELNHISANLSSLLEPLIMVILGVFVGGIIIGMYLPIFQLGKII